MFCSIYSLTCAIACLPLVDHRTMLTVVHLQVQQCQLDADISSKDNTSYMLRQCSEGYFGPVCSLCLRNGTHSYGRTGSLNCQLCRPAGLIVFDYIASTVLVLLLLCFNVHVTLQENLEEAAERTKPVRASELLRVDHQAFTSGMLWSQLPLLHFGRRLCAFASSKLVAECVQKAATF